MKSILILLLSFSFSFAEVFDSPVGTAVPEELRTMMSSIAVHQSVRTTFVQTKEMKALKKPLISKGSLVYSKGKGIIWNRKFPVQELTLIKPDGTVIIRDAQGKEFRQNSRGSERISGMMQQLFSGDLTVLQKQFQLFFTAGNDQRRLGLIPRRESMKKGITSLVMSVSNAGIMKEITMIGSEGKTVIVFTPEPQQKLTAAEEKLLDHP